MRFALTYLRGAKPGEHVPASCLPRTFEAERGRFALTYLRGAKPAQFELIVRIALTDLRGANSIQRILGSLRE